jgi:hypothetical protein
MLESQKTDISKRSEPTAAEYRCSLLLCQIHPLRNDPDNWRKTKGTELGLRQLQRSRIHEPGGIRHAFFHRRTAPA